MWEEKIVIPGPYNFDFALERLAMDPLHIVNIEERTVKVPIYGDKPEVALVKALGTIDEPMFFIQGENNETKKTVLQTLTRIFRWDVSLQPIYDHFQQTILRDIFSKHRGTPIILDFTPQETLMKAILHQQINMKFAISLTENFVKTFGFEKDGVPFYPKPESLSSLTVDELRPLKISQRKAEYLIGLATKLASGELNLEQIATYHDEDIIKTLVKIRGIGPWTSQSFLLFGLGRPNIFPYGDIGIQNSLKNLLGMDRKPTKEEMEKLTKEWEPFLSYAAFYLWRNIE